MFTDLRAADVIAAGALLRPLVRHTPLRRSDALSQRLGTTAFLKLECEQLTGSFKVRGALTALAWLPAEIRARGVVASSAGNHGLGVAFAAKEFGAPATIFIPATAPRVKREGIAALGATIDATQPHYDAAMDAAMRYAERVGATFINPCLGESLLAGQGTVALEILEDMRDLATLILPVGGGGLLGGCASLVRRAAPSVRIVGAQSVNTDAMARSLAAGRVVEIGYEPTLADGLAGQIDEAALDIGRHALDAIETVTEQEIERAIALIWREQNVRVEGSGAVGVALAMRMSSGSVRGPVAIVVSGGNIDPERHAAIRDAAA